MARKDPMAFVNEELEALKEKGLYQKLPILEGEQRSSAVINGKRVINLSSNKYLGFNNHPKLKEAVICLLDIYDGNRSKVAELLHMSRNTIAKIADEEGVMQEPQESVSISSEEYQKVLERLEKVEVWRDEHIKK